MATQTPLPLIPGVPRVYKTYKKDDGTDEQFEFLGPLSNRPRKLFLAKLSSSEVLVLVKIIPRHHNSTYGVSVHKKAAELGFAPRYFGYSELPGALPAHVMEFLPSPDDNTKPGWVPLHKLFESGTTTVYGHQIRASLQETVAALERNGMVHGDFRPPNVLIYTLGGNIPAVPIQLKLVDFDWSGPVGEVFYPVVRNEDIRWPGAPGSPIGSNHDRIMLDDAAVWPFIASEIQ